ncbi:monocarboxylate transporter 13-like [Gigantopelta aegis]|uniref:monocarboxylate transporter 13-like n=1 Tax=Gigantopelta aegis TaxID=1735272 RepID=UPI001B88A2AB|nr:monocarboxylate transporter 13-like [Gigantopelta aegis]
MPALHINSGKIFCQAMPSASDCEDVNNKQEKHLLYRLSSDESARSGSGNSTRSAVSHGPKDHLSVQHVKKQEQTNMQEKVSPRIDVTDYYPDGGWGWVVVAAATLVHVLCSGFHFAFGALFLEIQQEFNTKNIETAWLGSVGLGISLFVTPFITIICRRKSPRLYAVIGGLICALGCLFLAFSTQPEQLFISHCVVMSLGSGITIATANIMVGRYFRRRREIAEMILIGGTGVGTALMSVLFKTLISTVRWMHGLQCIAGLLILTIIAGALYRSASLYHPRRKVILHLKTQKKNRRDREAEKPPYLDFSALKMRSLQALLLISAVISLGIHIPFVIMLKSACTHKIVADKLLLLNVYLGTGFIVGCFAFGYITVRNSNECSISRRHLCQSSSILCGVFTLLLIMAEDSNAHALYAWGYGICCGAYYYSFKMYLYELMKSKLMERAWSYVAGAQCIPFLVGAPVSAYLSEAYKTDAAGYIFAGVVMLIGGLLFYAMPFFESHPSNQEELQKHANNSSATSAEAAALLDLDATDNVNAKPLNNAQCNIPHSKLKQNGKDGNKIQMQCYLQHKEREKPKQIVLSKIAEERDIQRNSEMTSNNKSDNISNKNEFSETITDGPSDSTFSNNTEKSSSKDSNSVKTNDSKKSKKTDNVRVDLFDPPSQEKESTATVSYDSDLYINLCEAQV